MNETKDVKAGNDVNSYQKVVVISETDRKPISEIADNDNNSATDAGQRDGLNYVTISSDGIETDYHKGGLIIGVLVIFLLGVLVGALVF